MLGMYWFSGSVHTVKHYIAVVIIDVLIFLFPSMPEGKD